MKPLFTFEGASDYVLDTQWSPIHPALFAMGDGSGRLQLWNINQDVDAPVYTAQISSLAPSKDKAAISRLQWSEDGMQIAAGSSTGTVSVFAIAKKVAHPDPSDMAKLYATVQSELVSAP